MVKTFEQYIDIDPYGEEEWEELQIGDRVICNTNTIKDKKGEIYDYQNFPGNRSRYLVYFDDVITETSFKVYGAEMIPEGHALWVNKECLKKIYE